MKRILSAAILGLTFVASMPAMEVTKKALHALYDANKKTDFLIPSLIGAYALKYSMTYSHELGHALASKLLVENSCPAKIHVSPLLTGGHTEITDAKPLNLNPESIKKRLAIYYLAGPLVGIATNILVLQAHNIFIEWSRNNSGDFLQACLKGCQKSLFNFDQSLWVTIPVVWDIAANMRSLINVEDNRADISHALESLQISNPRVAYPKITKFVSRLTDIGPLIAIETTIGLKFLQFVLNLKSNKKR